MDKKQKMLQNLKEYEQGLERLTEEEIQFAHEYPLTTIYNFAINTVDATEKSVLEKLMDANIVLKNKVKYVEYLIQKCRLTNFNDLKILYETGMPTDFFILN